MALAAGISTAPVLTDKDKAAEEVKTKKGPKTLLNLLESEADLEEDFDDILADLEIGGDKAAAAGAGRRGGRRGGGDGPPR